MTTTSVANLRTREGREAYRSYWKDLVVDRNMAVLPSLVRLWQTAIRAGSFDIVTSGESVSISHPLGLRAGTRLFMEEVVVRRYFNNVQALVYLGAVVLLVFLALRFAGILSEEIALIGVGIEVIMLLMLFAVLFYSPEEEVPADVEPIAPGGNESEDTINEVLGEIEEIGGVYATLGLKLERLAEEQARATSVLEKEVRAIRGLDELAAHSERLDELNSRLLSLSGGIDRLNDKIDMLADREIEYRVRRELERLLDVGARSNGPSDGSR